MGKKKEVIRADNWWFASNWKATQVDDSLCLVPIFKKNGMNYWLQLVFIAGMVSAQATKCPKLLIFLSIVSNRQTERQGGGWLRIMIQQSLSITSHTNGKIGIIFSLIYQSTWENCFQFKSRTLILFVHKNCSHILFAYLQVCFKQVMKPSSCF